MEEAGAIDLCALEKELQAALAADEKYHREDDAKFRAVHQKVASYEEFRDIVLASHLKPLERKDKMGQRKNLVWNSCARKVDPFPNHPQMAPLDSQSPTEFYRDWRRSLKSGHKRYQLLLQLGGHSLGRIFRADLGFGLLGEFLVVFSENVQAEDRGIVLQILQSLSGTKRFGLNVDLLSQPERESCRDLFGKLQRMGRNSDTHGISDSGVEAGLTALTKEQREAEGESKIPGPCQGGGTDERLMLELMRCYQVSTDPSHH
uniref:Coiled-coil domain containing 103 n=1 Tax=Sphenodon punctatus TaxID=8508 RepID=A0A8D0H0T0_SPHPU